MFIELQDGTLINTKFVKKITKTTIIIANTTQTSLSNGAILCCEREDNGDETVKITPTEHQSILKQLRNELWQ